MLFAKRVIAHAAALCFPIPTGTRAIFDYEHDQFREMARRFFAEHCTDELHAQWEEDGQVSRELWRAAGEHGLLGVTMPEARYTCPKYGRASGLRYGC